MTLIFLVSSRLIYDVSYYEMRGTNKVQITEKKYDSKKKSEYYPLIIEKNYDYMMGGIISLSVGLFLIGYNKYRNKKST